MTKTLNKHIRVKKDHWECIERAAKQRGIAPSRLMIETTLQAVGGKNWPRTELEIRLPHSRLFSAQVLACDMIAVACKGEIEEIPQNISKIVLDLRDGLSESPQSSAAPVTVITSNESRTQEQKRF